MSAETNSINRREFVRLAGVVAAGSIACARGSEAEPAGAFSLFDGKTLEGWSQIENSATSLSSGEIIDPAAFAARIATGPDAVSLFIRARLDDTVKADLASYSAANPNAKVAISALVKQLNQLIAGPSIYDPARFGSVALRSETSDLFKASLQGIRLARFNKVLLEDAYPADLVKSATAGWTVKDGAMASMGTGRGVIYTAKDFSRYRLTFTMRHISGSPDHQACVLVFCARPSGDEKPLDALGGIQFQVPNGGHWDYRQGVNNSGGSEFTTVNKTHFDVHEWSRIEILADAAKGTARMAVAQPLGSRSVEALDFADPAAGKIGPIALQMHNAGLFDEYKDITIELNPKDNDLITLR